MNWRAPAWPAVSTRASPRCAIGCMRSAPTGRGRRCEDGALGIRLTPGATPLGAPMRAHGAYTALISGGFSVFAGVVRRALAFDETIANTLLVENGFLAGLVCEPVVTRETKL